METKVMNSTKDFCCGKSVMGTESGQFSWTRTAENVQAGTFATVFLALCSDGIDHLPTLHSILACISVLVPRFLLLACFDGQPDDGHSFFCSPFLFLDFALSSFCWLCCQNTLDFSGFAHWSANSSRAWHCIFA